MSAREVSDIVAKGKVSVRNQGVVVIDDMRSIDEVTPGFSETVYCSGNVKGAIDADFLRPLAARTGFEFDENWRAFIRWLEWAEPTIRAEVEGLLLDHEIQRLEAVRDRAIKLAQEILEEEPFKDLELLGGMRRERGKKEVTEIVIRVLEEKPRRPTGAGGKQPGEGDKPDPPGPRFSLREIPLEDK